MSEPRVRDVCAGGLAIHLMIFDAAGDVAEGHAHTYDHYSLVGSGRVLVEAEGKSAEVAAHELVFIPKLVKHKLTALEAGSTVTCLHVFRDGDLTVVKESA